MFCTCASLSEGVLTVEQRAAVRSGTVTASYIRSLRSLSVAVVLCCWRVPSNSRILKTILAAFPLRTGCKLKFWSSWVLCRALCVCLLCHVYSFLIVATCVRRYAVCVRSLMLAGDRLGSWLSLRLTVFCAAFVVGVTLPKSMVKVNRSMTYSVNR